MPLSGISRSMHRGLPSFAAAGQSGQARQLAPTERDTPEQPAFPRARARRSESARYVAPLAEVAKALDEVTLGPSLSRPADVIWRRAEVPR